MSVAALPPVMVDAGLVERVTASLRHDGYAVVPDALPLPVVEQLHASFRRRHDHDFDRAGIGRDVDEQLRPTVRSDLISWLDGDDEPTRWYVEWAELLRRELNRALFLGLFEYECHFAWYPAGAFYANHLDAFRGERNRVVSTVLYLNPSWAHSDGGELVLYAPDAGHRLDPATPLVVERIVEPRFGTFVVFLSEEFPHEVLPTTVVRASIAGWYRLNTSSSCRADPPPG